MEDVLKQADNVAAEIENGNILPEEGKKQIMDMMEEAAKNSPAVNVLRDIEENPTGPSEGEFVPATVAIDPETGAKSVIDTAKDDDLSFEDKLDNLSESFSAEDLISNIEITTDDVKQATIEGNILDDNGFNISDKAALELVEMLNKYNKTGKITYKDFPEETKKYFDKYFKDNGITGYNVQSNTMRNMIAEAFADELKNNIQMKKFNEEFNDQIEGIFDKMNEEISPMFMDYNNSREDYINKVVNSINDEEKKKKAEAILDSIHDAFELTRLIEAAPKTKIKKFYLEKPEKVYNIITSKYKDNNYHIYDLALVAKTLDKHLKQNNIIPEDDETSAIKVVILFALTCANYIVEEPDQHAFMYYFTYTAVLLEIYKAGEYDKFAPVYLGNVKKVIDNLRK